MLDRHRKGWRFPLFAVLGLAVVLIVGCSEGVDEAAETATIEPATPEPNVDVDNDPALTRTVDPGEDRSPYEGGPLEDDEVVGEDSPEPVSPDPDGESGDSSESDEGAL